MNDIVPFARKADLESNSERIDVDLAPRRDVAAKLVALLRDAGIECELLAPASGHQASGRAQRRPQ